MFSGERFHNFPWMAQCYPYIFQTSQKNLFCCNVISLFYCIISLFCWNFSFTGISFFCWIFLSFDIFSLFCWNFSCISPYPSTSCSFPFGSSSLWTPACPRLWTPNPSLGNPVFSTALITLIILSWTHPALFMEAWKSSSQFQQDPLSVLSTFISVFCCCLGSPRGKFPFIATAPWWELLSFCKLLKLLGFFCKKKMFFSHYLWSWQLLLNIQVFFFFSPLLAEL